MMEGQLFKRNEAHRWKKRWVNLSNTHISIFKGKDKESKTPKMVKLQHSSVREFADDSRKGFELLAQDGKHYVFSAEHETENGTWITAIRTVLDDLMNMALTDNADHDVCDCRGMGFAFWSLTQLLSFVRHGMAEKINDRRR
jgi:hypothetical protein